MSEAAADLIPRLRTAARRAPARATLLGLAFALAVAQLVLQAHSISHDLLPSNHQVCEHCVVFKHAAPPPAVAGALPAPVAAAVLADVGPRAPTSRAPLVVRSRAPPSLV